MKKSPQAKPKINLAPLLGPMLMHTNRSSGTSRTASSVHFLSVYFFFGIYSFYLGRARKTSGSCNFWRRLAPSFFITSTNNLWRACLSPQPPLPPQKKQKTKKKPTPVLPHEHPLLVKRPRKKLPMPASTARKKRFSKGIPANSLRTRCGTYHYGQKFK